MSDNPFTFEDLKRLLVDRVGMNPEDVTNEPDLTFDEMGLDSLAFVELQLAMENEYHFRISDEDAHRIITVSDAIDFMNEQLAERSH